MIDSNMTTEQAKLQQAIAGCTVFPSTSQISLLGKTMTPAQLVQTFQSALAAMTAAATAKTASTNAVSAQTAARSAADALYKALRMFAVAQWGKGSPFVAAFGFSTAAPKARTAEQKALSAAKAKRTKQVRGVEDKVQRAQVTVDGSPGLQLVAAKGTVIPGVTQGPVSPAVAPGVQTSEQTTAPTVMAPAAPTAGK